MNFIKDNAGTIAAGAVVFAVIALAAFRLFFNMRKGKSGCACGGKCGKCVKE